MNIRPIINNYHTACIVLGIFSLLFAVCLALGVIWVRQDSARVGLHLREAENAIAESELRLRYLRDKHADIHTPANLIRYIEGDLKPAMDHQIIWLRPDRTLSVQTKSNELEPFALSFELAFLGGIPRR